MPVDEQKLRSLLSDMVSMLITYEIELTAYRLVLVAAQDRVIHVGIPWDMESNLRKLSVSLALQTEAEAEYAPFYGLLRTMTPQALDAALECMKRRIAHQNRLPTDPPIQT